MFNNGRLDNFEELVAYIISIINGSIIPLMMALALFWFLYGVIEFVRQSGNATARENGRLSMIYGIIGLAVMVSVWGLVNLVIATFPLNRLEPSPSYYQFRAPQLNSGTSPRAYTPDPRDWSLDAFTDIF